jgi:PIN domain nuclease of toxin-antitoxin system
MPFFGGSPAMTRSLPPQKAAILDETHDIFVSAASAGEITTKYRIGKLPSAAAIVADLDNAVISQGFVGLPISFRHGEIAGALPGPHRDPFDRMLVAQAMLENLVLVSNERPFDAYGIKGPDSIRSANRLRRRLYMRWRNSFWRVCRSAWRCVGNL